MSVNKHNGQKLLYNTFLGEQEFFSAIDFLFGILRNGPANPIFWFVRVLIIVFFTAPLWISIRRLSPWLLLLLAVVGMCFFTPVSFVSPCETLGWYSGIQYISKHRGLHGFCLVCPRAHLRLKIIKSNGGYLFYLSFFGGLQFIMDTIVYFHHLQLSSFGG